MATTAPPSQPPAPPADNEPVYGGFTRFEIELEVTLSVLRETPIANTANHPPVAQFVQSLANPLYLNHLATQKLLTRPEFVAYLAYLQYWTRPPYLKYLMYPGPTLKHLDLLQQEQFRQDIISPDLVQRLIDDGMRAAVEWHRSEA
ncbi:RNA polymerase II transcription subunit 31 mediator [Colletotrichum karsti]|uniref:Mediator of RNA polymerase II transcription subunit 31 n=1 Tax=Colletotrichum karsti TaxID=1095194 RepID=A0A9P6I3D4_9PEZI|nr:RNA polymerase II transcription subunit 31 mediator [Colletotrichum karsti]KAF9875032.1 RNA polymerase II transcription subunit 31 mediator [Colletotrichum karsti]